jgi:hypothetical protein
VKKAGWERESWKGAWLLARGYKYLLGGLPGFAAASACLCTSKTTWATERRLQDRLLLLSSLGQVSTKYPLLFLAAFCLRTRLSEKNKKKTRKRARDLLSYRFLVVAACCPLAHQSSVIRVAD